MKYSCPTPKNRPAAPRESGFSVLPGGYRGYDGSFYGIGLGDAFWLAPSYDDGTAWDRYLYYDRSVVRRSSLYTQGGFSVRVVRD